MENQQAPRAVEEDIHDQLLDQDAMSEEAAEGDGAGMAAASVASPSSSSGFSPPSPNLAEVRTNSPSEPPPSPVVRASHSPECSNDVVLSSPVAGAQANTVGGGNSSNANTGQHQQYQHHQQPHQSHTMEEPKMPAAVEQQADQEHAIAEMGEELHLLPGAMVGNFLQSANHSVSLRDRILHHHHVSQRGRGLSNTRQRRGSPSHMHMEFSDQTNSSRLDEASARMTNAVDKRQRSSGNSSHVCNSGGHSSSSGIQFGSHPSYAQAFSHNQQGAPYNWQSSRTTVKERLQYMFNNEVMADVHFIVGKSPQTQRIPAHRFVLAISSAVFDAMFNGGMANNSDEIEIPDVEPSAFLALLRFLYTDEVQIGPETVMTTLYTAKKYAIPALERACVEFLKRNLCSENAFMLLTQARLFDEPQLAALCLETIDKNTSEALNAEGFTDIDLDTLCVVLERDTLGIRECKLFGAVCRWAGAEAQRQNLPVTPENQRAVLGRALNLMRFPLMTVEEFAVGAAQSGILTDREVVELFLHFTVNPKPGVNFPDTPRCCLTGKEQVVARFCQIESRWGYSGTSDRIRFMVNRRIFVVGFGLYGSIHGPSEYGVNIQIIHTDTGKVCGQNDSSFQCDGTTTTFRIMFKEPVEIQPNTNYTACATLKGPDSYYGTKGLRKVTHESLTSGKVTFQFTYAAGNNNGTSVEDGQLPEIIFYT